MSAIRARLASTADRLRAGLGSRRRRGTFRAVAVIAGLGAIFAVVFFVGAAAVLSFADEYGFRPERDAATWRALTPAYGDISLCARCHATEYGKLTSASHAGIGCESCHGPLGSHALASPGTAEAKVAVAVPTDAVCVKCHVAAVGRPAGFRQIVPADHYTPLCLECHDPHTGISRRPPIVQHPLDRLPPCVTCHGPDGFKARDQRHPTVSNDDKVCLSCHLAGRGPTDGNP